MSTNPNDPFQNPNAVGYEQAPPKKGKGCLIGCLLIGLVGLLVCCGGGYFLFSAGMSISGEALTAQIQDDPSIREHIGEIESASFSFSGTMEEAQSAQAEGGQPGAVFEIEGSKGSGRLIISDNGGDGTATLKLPDGSTYPVASPIRTASPALGLAPTFES